MNEMPDSLLAADEPAPVTVHNENGLSPFLIVADHAGNSMPRALGRLGVPETECERHIAWDIGIAAVCRLVADALDATLVQQNYSRLVIEGRSARCSRPCSGPISRSTKPFAKGARPWLSRSPGTSRADAAKIDPDRGVRSPQRGRHPRGGPAQDQ